MKLPDKIVGRNKLRDAKICALWADDLKTTEEIGEMFGVTNRRVNQILFANPDFLKVQVEWEKSKRVHWIKRAIKVADQSRKDPADLQLQLKHEIEGEKPIIHIGHNQFFENIISKPKLETNSGTNRVEHVSKD